jgi:hypothetical protein
MQNRSGIIIGSICIALSLSVCGYFLSNSLYKMRFSDRTVMAKGFSERDVKSNLAVWNINLSIKGNDLKEMLLDLQTQEKVLMDFLKTYDIPEDNVFFENIHTQDLLRAQTDTAHLAQGHEPRFRYILGQSIKIRSSHVDKISKAMGDQNELVSSGVMVQWSHVSYFFTSLNELRPSMLSESIKSAQKVAQQMAYDCGAQLGKIRTLNQGIFTITAQDQNSGAQTYDDSASLYKKVRIVSTLSYFLKD